MNSIPSKWLDTLVKRDYIENLSNSYQNTVMELGKGKSLEK